MSDLVRHPPGPGQILAQQRICLGIQMGGHGAVLQGLGVDEEDVYKRQAYSGSVPVKLSGLYSKRKLPSYSRLNSLMSLAPSTAICLISSLDLWNTSRRWASLVEL